MDAKENGKKRLNRVVGLGIHLPQVIFTVIRRIHEKWFTLVWQSTEGFFCSLHGKNEGQWHWALCHKKKLMIIAMLLSILWFCCGVFLNFGYLKAS